MTQFIRRTSKESLNIFYEFLKEYLLGMIKGRVEKL